MKTVIAINGKPRAGKDTAVKLMRDILDHNDVPSTAFSSIDPVKAMLRDYVDLRAKSEKDRKLLAVVGDALEEHSDFRTSASVFRIEEFFEHEGGGVFFLHMREPDLILKVKEACELRGIRFIRIYLESDRAEDVTSNAADAGVVNGEYDHTLRNNSSIAALSLRCRGALNKYRLLQSSIQHKVD